MSLLPGGTTHFLRIARLLRVVVTITVTVVIAVVVVGALEVILCAGAFRSAFAATHLIAVGNNEGRADEPKLRFAERDAQEFTSVLRRLGNIEAENTRLLLGEDAEAFRRVLLNANVRLRSAPSAKDDDALIIYYSGHADATGLHLGRSVLRFDELKALVEGSPARVRLLIVDSCRSGGITAIKGAHPTSPFAIRLDQQLEAEGLAIITSSAESEDSQESETLRGSFFTHHFVTALRGAADFDHNGRITLNEAYGYAYRGTLLSSGQTTQLQHPTYRYELKGKGDLALTFLDAAPTQFGNIVLADPGAYVVLEGDDTGSIVAEINVEEGGAHILLQSGRYLIRRRSDTFYKEYAVKLNVGQTVDLEGVPFREITYARLLRKGGGTRASIHSLSLMTSIAEATPDGYGLSKSLAVGYAIDFAWITLGAELRMAYSAGGTANIQGTERDLALRLRAERVVDVSFASFGLAVLVEANGFRQDFDTEGDAPARTTWAAGLGSMISIERSLFAALALRLEVGVMTYIVPVADIQAGAETASKIETPLRPFVALGGRFSL
ncbi:MAG: caspase family protein [Deltaproteobacteria bacterium]|nr:caspase family protein [Deltaproteobacteria bacterium]